MEFQDFIKELYEGMWKEVDDLEVQYYSRPQDKLRIIGQGAKVIFRIVRVDGYISPSIKKKIDKIREEKRNEEVQEE